MRRAIYGLLLLVSAPLWAQNPAPEPNLLNFSITGWSSSSSPAENATYAMTHREVQRLLLDIAESPRDRRYVEQALDGSGVTLEDMLSNMSLRLQDGRYWLNFSLLTRADQEIVRRVTDTYSRSLADALLAHRPEIEALLKQYDLKGIDKKAVAFVVLGCFSLDWDGLYFSTLKGYRAEPPKRKNGEFFFMAEETGGLSLKQIYWGSHNSGWGQYQVTTFGDHFAPRTSLGVIRRYGPKWAQEMPPDVLRKKASALMFALREGPQTAVSLAKVVELDATHTEELLSALEKIGWVVRQGGEVRANVPVLTKRDKPMVRGLMKIGRAVMEQWLAKNYEPFHAAVKEITPVRQGAPYSQTFDQMWHYLFGIANQRLVESRLFLDPYAEGTQWPGYVSVVWEEGINRD